MQQTWRYHSARKHVDAHGRAPVPCCERLVQRHSWRGPSPAVRGLSTHASSNGNGEVHVTFQGPVDVLGNASDGQSIGPDVQYSELFASVDAVPDFEADWWGPGTLDLALDARASVGVASRVTAVDEQSNLLDVFHATHIDAQSAAIFFSQLATRNSLEGPLSEAELLHASRIADISGYSLPPVVAAQLQQLVSPPGSHAAGHAARHLLAGFGHDLSALLGMLRSQDVRPSAAWVDAALAAWLDGGAAAAAARAHARDALDAFGVDGFGAFGAAVAESAAAATDGREEADASARSSTSSSSWSPSASTPPPSVSDVRAVMAALEVLFAPPEASPPSGSTDAAADGPALPLGMAPPAAAAAAAAAATEGLLFPPPRDAVLAMYPYILFDAPLDSESDGEPDGTAAAPPPPAAAAAAAPTYSADAAGCLRRWLDVSLTALLDGGGLAGADQREDLYGMLPYLRTAPSAAVVERLYGEAWPPYPSGVWAASPEATAGLLCLCAASGARLPLGALHRELSALEQMLLLFAPPTPGIDAASFRYQRPPVRPMGSSANGRGGGVPGEEPLFPPSAGVTGGAGGHSGPRRLTPHAAFLALSAFHHLGYVPGGAAAGSVANASGDATAATATAATVENRTVQAALGGVLLTALQSEPGRLCAAARCRALRALLHCLPGALPRLLLSLTSPYDAGPSDRSRGGAVAGRLPLLAGWEELPAAELLGLLDAAAAAAAAAGGVSRRRGSGGLSVRRSVRYRDPLAALGLMHLADQVVQLPGWPQRLAAAAAAPSAGTAAGASAAVRGGGVAARCNSSSGGGGAGLLDLTRSLRSLLGILAAAGLRPRAEYDADAEVEAGAEGDGDGAGLAAAAQALLAAWLDVILASVEDGVRAVTQDWGRRSAPSLSPVDNSPWQLAPTPTSAQRPPTAPRPPPAVPYMAYDALWPSGDTAGGGSAGAGAVAASPLSLRRAVEPAPTVPSHYSPPAASAAPSERVPYTLSAVELTAALTALHDAAAALDERSHTAQHRGLVWAVQRLGSRCARCQLAPTEHFARVPELLLQMSSVAWVDVPLEWAHAVVKYDSGVTDPRVIAGDADPRVAGGGVPTWFRRLSWQDALRTAATAGQLVQHARTEVLRLGGALAEVPAAAAAVMPAPPAVSRARGLLAAATSLRDHVAALLAARAAAVGAGEVRQAAVAWQSYDIPYDNAAMCALLGALAGVAPPPPPPPPPLAPPVPAAAGTTVAAEPTLGTLATNPAALAGMAGPAGDAARRLFAVCKEQQAPQDEVEELFAVLSESV